MLNVLTSSEWSRTETIISGCGQGGGGGGGGGGGRHKGGGGLCEERGLVSNLHFGRQNDGPFTQQSWVLTLIYVNTRDIEATIMSAGQLTRSHFDCVATESEVDRCIRTVVCRRSTEKKMHFADETRPAKETHRVEELDFEHRKLPRGPSSRAEGPSPLFAVESPSSSAFPSYISGVHHSGVRFLRLSPFLFYFNPIIEVITFRLCG